MGTNSNDTHTGGTPKPLRAAARAYMAAHGGNYTTALRAVRTGTPPRGKPSPLLAAATTVFKAAAAATDTGSGGWGGTTIVQAPGGHGKTVLLCDYLATTYGPYRLYLTAARLGGQAGRGSPYGTAWPVCVAPRGDLAGVADGLRRAHYAGHPLAVAARSEADVAAVMRVCIAALPVGAHLEVVWDDAPTYPAPSGAAEAAACSALEYGVHLHTVLACSALEYGVHLHTVLATWQEGFGGLPLNGGGVGPTQLVTANRTAQWGMYGPGAAEARAGGWRVYPLYELGLLPPRTGWVGYYTPRLPGTATPEPWARACGGGAVGAVWPLRADDLGALPAGVPLVALAGGGAGVSGPHLPATDYTGGGHADYGTPGAVAPVPYSVWGITEGAWQAVVAADAAAGLVPAPAHGYPLL